MRNEKIEAYVGKGSERTLAGTEMIQIPESMDEAIEIFGSKRALVEAALKHRVIEVQASIRAKFAEANGGPKAGKRGKLSVNFD